MNIYRYEGKSESEVLNLALYELNTTEEKLIYKTTEEKAGLLKGKKIILYAYKIEDIAEVCKEEIKNIFKSFKIEGNIETQIREKNIKLKIHSTNNGILIGKRGSVIESLQNYLRQVIFNETGKYLNILVDVENYKEKQYNFLEKKVKNLAREVQKTKIDIKLDPMNAYERKIVHDALNDFHHIITESEGESPNRYVVIKYKD